MATPFAFSKKSLALLITAAALSASSGAWAVACPSPSGGQLLVDNLSVDSTCTVGSGESVEVTGSGEIVTASTPALVISNVGSSGQVLNNGRIESTDTALLVQGTVNGDITNNKTIAATGNSASSQAISLDNGTLFGSLINNKDISAVKGNAIDVSTSLVTGAIQNSTGAWISGGGGNAAEGIGISVQGSTVQDGIRNLGHINASEGIHVNNASVGAGGILNANTGSLMGDYGLWASGGTITGSLENRGLILSNVSAIRLDNDASVATIKNSGTLETGQESIFLFATANAGNIENTGTVTSHFTHALHVNVSTVTGDIHNGASGELLSGQGQNALMIQNTATLNGDVFNEGYIGAISGENGSGLHVIGSTINGNIRNTGNIFANAGLMALRLDNATITQDVINSGSIGGVDADTAISLESVSSIRNIVNNSNANITANLVGVSVTSGSTLTALNNSGTITASKALDLANSANAFVVSNSGALNGDVLLGINQLDLLSGGTVTGNVVGGAGSILNIGTGVNLNTFTAQGDFLTLDQLNIRAGSQLNARSGIQIGSTTLTNAGTLAIGAGDTLSLTGDYVQATGGVLRTGLASANSYGKLAASGNVNLTASGAINVNVVGAPVIAVGTVMADVITAGGTLTAGTLTVTDNSFLFDLGAEQRGNAIDLRILGDTGNTTEDAVISTDNKSAEGAAAVFSQLIANGATGDMQTVITALGSLGSAEEVSDAITQTVPLSAAAGSQAILSSLNGVNSVIGSRQQGDTGLSSGDGFLGNEVVWLKPFGSWANQDDHDGVFGFDARSHGLIVGMDGHKDNVRLGAAFAYSTIDVTSNAAHQSADVDGYNAVFYGGYDLDDRTSINLQADAGFYKTDGERTINFGGLDRKAKSDFDSWSGHLGAELAHDLPLSEATVFTPSVRADYTYLNTDSYKEDGAGALNLDIDSNSSEAFVLGVDGKLAYAVATRTKVEANLGVGYDLINDQASITSAFAGAPSARFSTRGIDPNPWITRGGLGVIGQVTDTVELSVRYDAEVREDFDNQTASVKVSWLF